MSDVEELRHAARACPTRSAATSSATPRGRACALATLLDRAGVQAGATQIVGRSVDGFTAGFPTEVGLDGRTALVAVAMNGEPLPAEHGFPPGSSSPGSTATCRRRSGSTASSSTTWEDFDGYWIPRGWSKEGPIKTASRIDVPRSGATIDSGRQPIAGVAWAPPGGIARVEVQVDDGEWIEAQARRRGERQHVGAVARRLGSHLRRAPHPRAGDGLDGQDADRGVRAAGARRSRLAGTAANRARAVMTVDAGVVLAWGVPRLRDLPWRATRDPWRILVAEVMLQQTQAPRVIPKWTAFCATLPDTGGVRGGIARRRAAAVAGARLPAPGAQPARRRQRHRRAPRRCGARHDRRAARPARHRPVHGAGGAGVRLRARRRRRRHEHRPRARPGDGRAARRCVACQALGDALVPHGAGWVWNQVLMDLGATVCRPAPRCATARCPRRAPGTSPAGRRPTRPTARPASARRQAPVRRRATARHAATCCARCTTAPVPPTRSPRASSTGSLADRLVVRTGDVLHLP